MELQSNAIYIIAEKCGSTPSIANSYKLRRETHTRTNSSKTSQKPQKELSVSLMDNNEFASLPGSWGRVDNGP